jgi:hypothetical protein
MGKSKEVDRAVPRIPQERAAEEIVAADKKSIAGIKGSANYNAGTEVPNAVTAWENATNALDANNQAKAKAKLAYETALAAEPTLIRRASTRRRGVINAIDAFSDGSKEVALSFTVELEGRQPSPDAIVPQNLRPMKLKKPTVASVRWDPVEGCQGYEIQHCTNPADPSTFSTSDHVTGSRFDLLGQAPGTTVYFRVLSLDKKLPGGKTAYTTWVPVVVT